MLEDIDQFTQMRSGAFVGSGMRFELLAPAAKTDRGIVFRAHDHEFDRAAAVSVLHRAERLPAFLDESFTGALLGEHPGFVAVLDRGFREKVGYWYATEWLEGETLGRLAARSPNSQPELASRLETWEKIAAAVAFAHTVNDGTPLGTATPSRILIAHRTQRAVLLPWQVPMKHDKSRPISQLEQTTRPVVETRDTMRAVAGSRESALARDVYDLGQVGKLLLTGSNSESLGFQVPEDCPLDVCLLLKSCMHEDSWQRPFAQEVFDTLRRVRARCFEPTRRVRTSIRRWLLRKDL